MAIEHTPRLGLTQWTDPELLDPVHPDQFNADAAALDDLAAIAMQGTAAERPAAGVRGRLYYATDTGDLTYDTGTAWVPVGATDAGGGDIRLDALAAGQRLKATLTGDESETAQGVTVGSMVPHVATSAASLGTVTFTDAGDLITTSTAHGLVVGDPVSFGTITGSVGVTAGDVYFVLTVPSATTFTISNTVGGATRTITADGTATALYRRERAYIRQSSMVNPAIRFTETRPVQSNINYPRFESVSPDPSIITYAPGTDTRTSMRVETEYDGQVLGVVARNNGASAVATVYVDGRLATVIDGSDFTAAGIASGNFGIVTLSFTDARRRSIVVEFDGVVEWPGFVTKGYPLIFPTSATKGPRVLLVGDSFTEGTGAGTSRGYPRWLARLMGWRDLWRAGSGSTGYVNDGQRLALIDRYENDIIAQQAQIVIISMGLNDSMRPLVDVLTAAETIWDATLASSYTKELVIVGPWPNAGGTGTTQQSLIDMDAALAELAREKVVRYVSPIQEGWQFTLADATHPDPAGHEYIAWRLAGHLSVPHIAAA